ncbi:G-type lectin S-receptor-like serine/threonine-protein kinase CES101 [Pistacia vera]|uniref:G-type lectin S-receptor-like serine/threonine-protein kinase CES101 n=1 Tax=Pistacia vera TaxID=55513 RepID=UPI001263D4D0|nr:G-type lectin S-receptor-like serine/threonine-protein kinase CES101 [Pistacia vera]
MAIGYLPVATIHWRPHNATDTLMQGDMLNSSVPLVSRNEKFTLSFFRSPQRSGNGWYLGVSSGDNIEGQSIWVANREMPIRDDSVVLLIDETGSLLIKHNSGDSIKLFSGQSRTNLAAVLQDDGNFVLKETNSDGTANSEPPLWQSFDLPTNSLLPGMKLGINDKTGQNWSLTSWLSYSLPTPWAFTLECCSMLSKDGNSVTSLWLTSVDPCGYMTRKYLFRSLLCDGTPQILVVRDGRSILQAWSKVGRRAISNNDPQIIRVSDNRADLSLSDCKDMCWKNCTCVGVQEKALILMGQAARFSLDL